MTVSITPRGLRVGDEELPLLSGTMHYWRVRRAKWSECLDRVREMGFRIVETYVPWSVHEIERGRFDFGERTPEKDVAAFARLVHGKGMKLLVRPGPHINAELTYFGYPKRLFAMEDLLARSPDGAPAILPAFPRMFPVPSYASDRFYDEARVYFDHLGPRLAELIHPRGPVVGVQTDNEMSFFFRTALFDQDYSEGALALYRKFIRETYGDLAEANRVHGTDYADWDALAPPRRFEPEGAARFPYYLDWAAFKEHLIRYGLRRCKELLEDAGVRGAPVYHNHPPTAPGSPFDIATAERELAVVGFDLYPTRKEYAGIRRIARHLRGASRLPYIPEFSSGCFPWWTPITEEDQRFTTWAAFMHGVRAIGFYMIVEREMWFGSPVTREGRVRPGYFDLFQTFHRAIEESGLPGKDKETPALVLEDLDYDRLELAASLLDPIPPIVLAAAGVPEGRTMHPDPLGFARPIQIENGRVRALAEASLEAAQIPFDLAYTTVPLERLARYRLVVLPTFEFLARGVQERLVAYARSGGTLCIGPRVPELDRAGDPCDLLRYVLGDVVDGAGGGEHRARVHRVGEGRIVVATNPDASYAPASGLWEKLGVRPPVRWEGAGIDAALFRGAGAPILFVANPTAEPRAASIMLAGARRARDLLARGEADLASLKLAPYSVRILEIAE